MEFPPTDYACALEDHTVHYAQAGAGDMLVFIHGSLCDYRYWRWQLPALSAQWHVVAPSLRGYWPQASQQADPRFSVARHAQDMAAFIQNLGNGRPAHILGHSRGAQVALELALQAPALVRTLTLADPGFRLEGEPAAPAFHGDMATLLRQGNIEAAVSGFVDKANGAGTWRQMTSWFKTMVKDNSRTLLSQAQEPHPAVNMDQVQALDAPLLLIGGAHSPERYASRLRALQDALPQATRVTIPMAAHGMNLANPRAFNQTVTDFLINAG
ncbi:alpha/beta fold hydrolase [Allopusillimonas ginsengisoli]|uniref:alpha/beta fold hydrolase n=1 Tax=Allopusillimonas ginsengisoli TaxID=453575 RepID=UPI00101EDF0D|nr:alpha/beta hydrolase [Allopusillimonas ginsengisoli]TEA78184.1 alpha/beta hydrolase [Allopusillimonas ginsengisoli]